VKAWFNDSDHFVVVEPVSDIDYEDDVYRGLWDLEETHSISWHKTKDGRTICDFFDRATERTLVSFEVPRAFTRDRLEWFRVAGLLYLRNKHQSSTRSPARTRIAIHPRQLRPYIGRRTRARTSRRRTTIARARRRASSSSSSDGSGSDPPHLRNHEVVRSSRCAS
jgi:hypothetical protein